MTVTEIKALAYGRRLTDPPLLDALQRLDDQTRLVAGYQLGFWDAKGATSDAGGGKRIRPALALLSAQASGAAAEVGIPAAVACELVHNFSLLHDDLMDNDRERHHRATAWVEFGAGSAILAGDALLSLASEVLAEAPSATAPWAVRCLAATTRRLIAGQTCDLSFEERGDVGLEECLQMAGDKTAALLGCAASLGAVLADAPADLALGLADFGGHLGLAFQLVDDLLGIWGSPDRTGKPVLSDLRSRKKSVPVVAALTSGSPAGTELRELYHRDAELSEDDLQRAAELVEAAGGRRWTQERIDTELGSGLEILDGLAMPTQVRTELALLASQLNERDH